MRRVTLAGEALHRQPGQPVRIAHDLVLDCTGLLGPLVGIQDLEDVAAGLCVQSHALEDRRGFRRLPGLPGIRPSGRRGRVGLLNVDSQQQGRCQDKAGVAALFSHELLGVLKYQESVVEASWIGFQLLGHRLNQTACQRGFFRLAGQALFGNQPQASSGACAPLGTAEGHLGIDESIAAPRTPGRAFVLEKLHGHAAPGTRHVKYGVLFPIP